MSVAQIDDWRLAGCGASCWPRSHDPEAHEQYGREQEREIQRRSIVRTGSLVIDLQLERVTVEGREVVLGEREWQILAYLGQRPGQTCPAREIQRAVWGEFVSNGALRTTLNRLRAKLGAAGRLVTTPSGCNARATRRLELEPAT